MIQPIQDPTNRDLEEEGYAQAGFSLHLKQHHPLMVLGDQQAQVLLLHGGPVQCLWSFLRRKLSPGHFCYP